MRARGLKYEPPPNYFVATGFKMIFTTSKSSDLFYFITREIKKRKTLWSNMHTA